MTLKEMRKQALREPEYIPKHPKLQQSELRMAYFQARMHSLGKKSKEEKTAGDVLRDCINLLKKGHPNH
jgi:hypothetical protein